MTPLVCWGWFLLAQQPATQPADTAPTTQAASPPTASEPSTTLPEEVMQVLADVDDGSFAYAQPGFYAVLEFVQESPVPPGFGADPVVLEDWRVLLDRPTAYRGQAVTIEGVVGRNTTWRHENPRYERFGTLGELQVYRDDQPLVCKIVLTRDPADIPVGARVTITGYFVLIQQYYSETRRVRQAAVLVGTSPTGIEAAGPVRRTTETPWTGILFGVGGGLVLAWLLLRRRQPRPLVDRGALGPRQEAPFSLADELGEWARMESAETADKPRSEASAAEEHPGDADGGGRSRP